MQHKYTTHVYVINTDTQALTVGMGPTVMKMTVYPIPVVVEAEVAALLLILVLIQE